MNSKLDLLFSTFLKLMFIELATVYDKWKWNKAVGKKEKIQERIDSETCNNQLNSDYRKTKLKK